MVSANKSLRDNKLSTQLTALFEPESFNFKKLLGFTSFFYGAGSVRNAGRIWASTPQNRTYRAWGENSMKNGQLNVSVI